MTPLSGDMPVLGWGLRIASAVPVPGAVPWPFPPTETDVTITVGEPVALPPWPFPYRHAGEELDFAPPGVGRYRISRSSIRIEPHPQADMATISALLIATAMPALLWSRGQFMLHAAGVILAPNERCIAIAGPSGAGKSTLARWLLERGARLVGDDTLAIARSGDTAMCSGLPGGVFRDAPHGRQFEPLPEALVEQAQATRLGAIVVLAPGQPLAIRRLAGIDAFAAIMRNRHRPRVPTVLGCQQAQLTMAAALCRAIPVYELKFDKKCHTLQELGKKISQLVARGN